MIYCTDKKSHGIDRGFEPETFRATQVRSRHSDQLSRVYFCTMFTSPQSFHRAPDVWLSVGNTQLWYWPHGNRAVVVGKAVVITARVHCFIDSTCSRIRGLSEQKVLSIFDNVRPSHVKRRITNEDVLLYTSTGSVARQYTASPSLHVLLSLLPEFTLKTVNLFWPDWTYSSMCTYV